MHKQHCIQPRKRDGKELLQPKVATFELFHQLLVLLHLLVIAPILRINLSKGLYCIKPLGQSQANRIRTLEILSQMPIVYLILAYRVLFSEVYSWKWNQCTTSGSKLCYSYRKKLHLNWPVCKLCLKCFLCFNHFNFSHLGMSSCTSKYEHKNQQIFTGYNKRINKSNIFHAMITT